MKTFINDSEVKVGNEKTNIEQFIDKFNTIIKQGKNVGRCFCINGIIDNVPTLNDEEFKLVVKMADEQGWKLYEHDDDYDSITYMLDKK